MTTTEMYIKRVQAYVEKLPNEILQEECKSTIKQLRTGKCKRSYRWLYIALTLKDVEVWEKHGFGLMHTASYRAQINKILNGMDRQKPISWDDID